MKTIKLILAFAFVLVLSSCKSTYYQVCKVTYGENVSMKDSQLYYEDENCIIKYDMWAERGNIGFEMYNKTNSTIYLNLENCFFISNGMANNYYKNRIYTFSSSSGVSVSESRSITGVNYFNLLQTNTGTANSVNSKGTSLAFVEDKVIGIPAHSAKKINEYTILEEPYRDCTLFRSPTKKKMQSVNFTSETTPFVFSNRIEYQVGKVGNTISVENKFFVSQITNYSQSEFVESVPVKFCGETENELNTKSVFKLSGRNMFYLKYESEFGSKH